MSIMKTLIMSSFLLAVCNIRILKIISVQKKKNLAEYKQWLSALTDIESCGIVTHVTSNSSRIFNGPVATFPTSKTSSKSWLFLIGRLFFGAVDAYTKKNRWRSTMCYKFKYLSIKNNVFQEIPECSSQTIYAETATSSLSACVSILSLVLLYACFITVVHVIYKRNF